MHPSFIQNQPFYDASWVRKSSKSSCRIAKEDEGLVCQRCLELIGWIYWSCSGGVYFSVGLFNTILFMFVFIICVYGTILFMFVFYGVCIFIVYKCFWFFSFFFIIFSIFLPFGCSMFGLLPTSERGQETPTSCSL